MVTKGSSTHKHFFCRFLNNNALYGQIIAVDTRWPYVSLATIVQHAFESIALRFPFTGIRRQLYIQYLRCPITFDHIDSNIQYANAHKQILLQME